VTSNDKDVRGPKHASYGKALRDRREKANKSRKAKAEETRVKLVAAGVKVNKKRKNDQRAGSDRIAERRARRRMSDALASLREDIASLLGLVHSDQALVEKLEQTPERIEARETSGRTKDREEASVLPEYHALVSHLSYMIREFDGLMEQFEELESRPRMVPVVHSENARTDAYVASMIDGSRYRVMTRSLRQYGINADDYRRLFGLPDDYMLWIDEVKETRSEIISEKRVWETNRKRER
jgi:predicted transcriptional regulator